MLKREKLRLAACEDLLDPDTRKAQSCDPESFGLTRVGDNVHDSATDALDAFNEKSRKYDLPLIAIYTEQETATARDTHAAHCFDINIDLVIEIYAKAQSGFELEAELDAIEEEVQYKLFTGNRLYSEGSVLSYTSTTQRDAQGVRMGLRRLSIEIRTAEEFALDTCDPNFTHKIIEATPND